MSNSSGVHPPETIEGWFVLHQVFRLTPAKLGAKDPQKIIHKAASGLRNTPSKKARGKDSGRTSAASGGWSCLVNLIGSSADVMAIHFRDSLDAIGEAQSELARSDIVSFVEPVYSFLSVTEAGLYHITAELARTAEARGGSVGDEQYKTALAERASAEKQTAHIARRLYPERPDKMPYVCFYPMTKRRDAGQNWYTLSLDERSRLMQAHGITGRRYAGRVQQVISGAIGLDAWEWGVTLFAADPLDFKKLVTDMRFDEVSAKYAEFGDFYVGKLVGA
jgi:peroxiredoxin